MGRSLGFPLATLFLLAACAPADAPSPTASGAVSAPVATALAAKEPAKACDMVTEAEMSVILGGAVTAQRNDGSNGKTECIYSAVTGISPYVEFSVDWGSGEGAMMGMGMLGQHEPGMVSPYDGIGDQAAAVGPALMIRTGEDLVTIVFSGVDDTPAKAKQIFDTAKARM